jgi:hypothetical protein
MGRIDKGENAVFAAKLLSVHCQLTKLRLPG